MLLDQLLDIIVQNTEAQIHTHTHIHTRTETRNDNYIKNIILILNLKAANKL